MDDSKPTYRMGGNIIKDVVLFIYIYTYIYTYIYIRIYIYIIWSGASSVRGPFLVRPHCEQQLICSLTRIIMHHTITSYYIIIAHKNHTEPYCKCMIHFISFHIISCPVRVGAWFCVGILTPNSRFDRLHCGLRPHCEGQTKGVPLYQNRRRSTISCI